MASATENRYRAVITELGGHMRWYQTSRDLLYAAVIAAADGIAVPEILARSARLGETLPRRHELHLISQSVAAVSAARNIDTEAFVAAAEVAAAELRPAARSKRARRIGRRQARRRRLPGRVGGGTNPGDGHTCVNCPAIPPARR